MNTVSTRATFGVLAVASMACLVSAASAQPVRAFPQGTLRGSMTFGDYPEVRLNGRAMQLSPGSRVRNQDNMIVMAASLGGSRLLVHYTLGVLGDQVGDVWILRPEEAAIKPWPGTLEEAQTWTFDAETMRWTRP